MYEFLPATIPTASGVYLMKDADGTVLYVGKAKNLRKRLRSYFKPGGDGRPQIVFLLGKIAAIETIVTATEQEALLLENTLIKKYRPRYNIDLRDDKTYVSVRFDLREEFPAPQIVRQVKRDGARYLGPFASAGGVREILKELYRCFPLRHHPMESCRRRRRPCLFFQIGQCSAPCHGRIGREDYAELVKGAMALLGGHRREVVARLRERMSRAAAAERFEEAARLRDQLRLIEATLERQQVLAHGRGDYDVVGLHCEGSAGEFAVLQIRDGALIGSRSFAVPGELPPGALLHAALQQYYTLHPPLAAAILLPARPDEDEMLGDWLTELAGRRIPREVPQRGEKVRLLELAALNARERLRERLAQAQDGERLLGELQQLLHLTRLPRRMECYDISHLHGSGTVAAAVVFVDGEPCRAAYRRYRIKTVAGGDDYAAMGEVLTRRLARWRRGEGEAPDLLLIDGGRGQLAAALQVLDELGLAGRCDVAALAKARGGEDGAAGSDERVFLPGRKNPLVLKRGSAVRHLLERLRDETHRSALAYQQHLRGREGLAGLLDTIPGIGARRRVALLRHFGSLRGIAEATDAEVAAVAGVGLELAARCRLALGAPSADDGN